MKPAFERGGTVSQIIHGTPIGGGPVDPSLRIVDAAIYYRYRRENPEFDRFVAQARSDSKSAVQAIRVSRLRIRAQNIVKREQTNDYYTIRASLERMMS